MLIRRLILPIVVITVLSACRTGAPQSTSNPTTTPAASNAAPTAGAAPTLLLAPTTLIAPTQAPTTIAPATATRTAFAKKIDVGGRGLFMTCRGTGSPPVLLEANITGRSEFLLEVLLGVSQVTQVCTYDRAGAGKSDSAPGPRSGHQLVQDATILLKNAGIVGPYILAGHSFGGEVVRLYASEHPADVAGLITIDGTPNAFDARLLSILPEQGSAWLKELYHLDDLDMQATDAEMSHAAALPHIPFIVLTAQNRADLWPEDWPADKTKQVEQMWLELQHDMVQLVPGATQVIVNSGHGIPSEQPSEVVKAITTVVNAVRAKK